MVSPKSVLSPLLMRAGSVIGIIDFLGFCWAMAWSLGLFVSRLCLPCSLRLDAMVGFGLWRALLLDVGLFSVCGIRSGVGGL